MAAANIVDHRTGQHCVECNVSFEPSFHDNTCDGATRFAPMVDHKDYFSYDSLSKTTIADAIEYARKWEFPVTLYIYDLGRKLD